MRLIRIIKQDLLPQSCLLIFFSPDFLRLPRYCLPFPPAASASFKTITASPFSLCTFPISSLSNYFWLLLNFDLMTCALIESYRFDLLLFYANSYTVIEMPLDLWLLQSLSLVEPSSCNLLLVSSMLIFSSLIR